MGMKVGEVLMQAAEKVDVKEIPKITVPEQVTAPLADAGLMNPNELSTEDYNKYAAATIGTTFVFLLLGSQIFDISGLLFGSLREPGRWRCRVRRAGKHRGEGVRQQVRRGHPVGRGQRGRE